MNTEIILGVVMFTTIVLALVAVAAALTEAAVSARASCTMRMAPTPRAGSSSRGHHDSCRGRFFLATQGLSKPRRYLSETVVSRYCTVTTRPGIGIV